jgi:hypothetical protein
MKIQETPKPFSVTVIWPDREGYTKVRLSETFDTLAPAMLLFHELEKLYDGQSKVTVALIGPGKEMINATGII